MAGRFSNVLIIFLNLTGFSKMRWFGRTCWLVPQLHLYNVPSANLQDGLAPSVKEAHTSRPEACGAVLGEVATTVVVSQICSRVLAWMRLGFSKSVNMSMGKGVGVGVVRSSTKVL